MSFQPKPPIPAIDCPNVKKIKPKIIQLLTDKYLYNEELTNEISSNKIDSDTQYRKGYYESEQYEKLLSWNKLLLFIYYILAIALVLILFFSPNKFLLTTYQTIGITLALLVYPFVIHYILKPFIFIYRFVIAFFPRSVLSTF
jgi:hypothetical protein